MVLIFQSYHHLPSVHWHCWLDVRKNIRPVKMSDEVLVWLSVWSEVQFVCIWSSWCHCLPKTPLSLASFESRLVLHFFYRLTHVVLEKRPLNACNFSITQSLPSVLWCELLVEFQEEHPASKSWAMSCCSYLSAARCRLFAYGLADATAIPVALLKSRIGLLFWFRLTQLSWKRGH